MPVLVSGASGHIGSAVVPELIRHGHEVIGLARSDTSAAAITAMGAQPRRGDLADLEGLRQIAAEADGVIHLAFDHATMRSGDMATATATDHAVVRAIGHALAGTGKPLVGIGFGPTGDPDLDAQLAQNPRFEVANTLLGLATQDVRAVLVAVPPVTHSDRDQVGFIPMMIEVARRTGVSGYPGDGQNTWPAAHTLDIAELFALAYDNAPAGAQLIGAVEPGVPVSAIAEVIGQRLELPTQSVSAEDLLTHFGPFGAFVGLDLQLSSADTQALLGWNPSHPTLLQDMAGDHYFHAPSPPQA